MPTAALRLRSHPLHGHADQVGQVLDVELLLELRAGVDHGLVADVEFVGDPAVGLALAPAATASAVRAASDRRADCGARRCAPAPPAWPYRRSDRAIRRAPCSNAFINSSDEVSLSTYPVAPASSARATMIGSLCMLKTRMRRADRAPGCAGSNRSPPRPLPCMARSMITTSGLMPPIETIAGHDVARVEHGLDAGILQHAPAALQHDRMIVDDQDAGHAPRSFRRSYRDSCECRLLRRSVPPVAAGSRCAPRSLARFASNA